MGWIRDERFGESLSPGGSPVAQDQRRMSAVRSLSNDPPEWLNIRNKDCPLLQPVLEAKRTPSNITIPELTVTFNPFANPIQQSQAETSQRAIAQKSVPASAGGTALTLGAYAVEAPPQGTAVPLTSDPNPGNLPVLSSDLSEGLNQMHSNSDRQSFFTPPAQSPTPTPTRPQQYLTPPAQSASNRPILPSQAYQAAMEQQREPQNVTLPAQLAPQPIISLFQASLTANEQQREPQNNFLPAQSTPKTPTPSFQAFLAARNQQRELSANISTVKATPLNPRADLTGLNREYLDYLINIQQLINYAKNYRQSWHYVVGLYFQRFRDPSTFQVAPHLWEKDAWKADMLQKNPRDFLTWPDPARGTIEHNIMEELRGSELKRQAMDAAIVGWSQSCQPREVINVMYKAGWTRRSEYVFDGNWTVMDTIKRMDEGPEKMCLLAKAERESPLFFKKCMEDEMCGSIGKRKLEHSLPAARQFHRGHPNSGQPKGQVDEKGPFGSGRLRRERPIRHREVQTVSGIDEIARGGIQQEKKHAKWKRFLAARDGTYVHVHPQPKQEKPTQVILHGYTPNNRGKAVAAYESISRGMICEDYHRDPKRCRYPGVANPPRKRPLTAQERLLSRYRGGKCWIRVTFDTKEAAQRVVRQSPHRIDKHLVFAHMYDGLGPREDIPIPWQGNGTSPNQICGCV